MQNVTIKYKKGTRTQKIELNLPSKWDQLSYKQFLYIAKMWPVWKELSEAQASLIPAKAKLFIELCDLGYFKKVQVCKALSNYNENSLGDNPLKLLDFLFEKVDLTKNMIPTINVGWMKQLKGPADEMADCSIEEFSFCFSAYSAFSRTEKEEHLITLMAILYRDTHKGVRVAFDIDKLPRYERLLKKVPKVYLQGTFLFFTGILTYLELRYSTVFKRSEQKNQSSGNFLDGVLAMSGGIFGPFESTKNTNMWVFMKQLSVELAKQKK